MSNKWKRELEKSVAAYESLIAKIKTENDAISRENNHWRSNQKARVTCDLGFTVGRSRGERQGM